MSTFPSTPKPRPREASKIQYPLKTLWNTGWANTRPLVPVSLVTFVTEYHRINPGVADGLRCFTQYFGFGSLKLGHLTS